MAQKETFNQKGNGFLFFKTHLFIGPYAELPSSLVVVYIIYSST